MKKNKTLGWLSQLPKENQMDIIDMAVKQRRHVKQVYDKEESVRIEKRSND